MIELRLNERLGSRSLYWLAKQSGIAYSTIHKLKKAAPQGISFDVLDKLCDALECAPGDLLVKVSEVKKSAKNPRKPDNLASRRVFVSDGSGKGEQI
jgi:DNA-binding Xre family transcriptional regulator